MATDPAYRNRGLVRSLMEMIHARSAAEGQLVLPWRGSEDDADCPPLIFLQLLFGYRSLAELRAIFPDVWANEAPSLLINILFPKLPSTVFSLDNT